VVLLIPLTTSWLGRGLEFFDEIDSTNEYLKREAHGLPHGAAVIATKQNAGKGRAGRGWQSGGLMTSFLLHGLDPQRISALPLVAGLATVKALEKLTGLRGFDLKWSNDVLCGGQKLGGILCESRISGSSAFAVTGIGVNISQTREELESLGLVYATSIKTATDESPEILALAHAIFNEFEPLFEIYAEAGFEPLKRSYKKRCVTLGREICVTSGKISLKGIASNITGEGGLVLDTRDGVVVVTAGEASVRGLYGYL
jgi:BirA family biotin operon repressor/biotin-[acetyl-CoA-carboxylase] ligase